MPLRHRPHRVIYVPADDRPCSVKLPRLLARMVDFELVMPPLELLGHFGAAGQSEAIAAWLLEQLTEPADCAIISLDMLAYGGLPASTTSAIRTQLAQERLDALAQVRAAAPTMPVFGFASILRLSITTSSDETAQYREYLRRYAVTAARSAQSDDPQAALDLQRLEQSIPGAVLGEYLAIRARNHEVNLRAVREAAEGSLDFLLLAQDEADAQGLHLDEQRRLAESIVEDGAEGRALICCGPDSAGVVLLARFIHQHMGKVPQIRAIYSQPEDTDAIPPLESMPFEQSVATLVQAVGGKLTNKAKAADLTLVINTPASQPRAAYKAPTVRQERARRLGEFMAEVAAAESERGIAVCDAAFAQGADDVFADALVNSGIPLPRLISYAGADTASDALSKVLAHGTLRLIALQDKGAFNLAHAIGELSPMRYLALLNSLIDAEKAHIEFLFQRFVTDWLYQTRVRPRAAAHVSRLVRGAVCDLRDCYKHAEAVVHDRLTHAATDLWIESFLGNDCAEIGSDEFRSRLTLAELEETRVRLPWRRLAEVDVDVEFGMQLEAEK